MVHVLMSYNNEGYVWCSIDDDTSAKFNDETQFFELPGENSLCCNGVPCAETVMCQERGLACASPGAASFSGAPEQGCDVCPYLIPS
jgi:hypothetical protein